MKFLTIAALSCIILLALQIGITADNIFPDFSKSSITIHLPIGETQDYAEDSEHMVGVNFVYTISGLLFPESSQAHIQTIAEGFSGETDKSSPWKTLTELLAAYQKKDVDAVDALYIQNSSQTYREEIDSNPELKEQYLNFMESIEGIDVMLGFDQGDGFLAIVKLLYSNTDFDVMPLYFIESDSKHWLSAIRIEDPLASNIFRFLQQGHTVSELLEPPVSGYSLIIEKSGTGYGKVVGSGMNCGTDCLGLYQEGTLIFLKAIASEDSVFEKWLVDGEPMKGPIEMHKDIIITAIFNQK